VKLNNQPDQSTQLREEINVVLDEQTHASLAPDVLGGSFLGMHLWYAQVSGLRTKGACQEMSRQERLVRD